MANFKKNGNGWTGRNGYGTKIKYPGAYYAAVEKDKYGFNSSYTLDQYKKYRSGDY